MESQKRDIHLFFVEEFISDCKRWSGVMYIQNNDSKSIKHDMASCLGLYNPYQQSLWEHKITKKKLECSKGTQRSSKCLTFVHMKNQRIPFSLVRVMEKFTGIFWAKAYKMPNFCHWQRKYLQDAQISVTHFENST